MEKDRSKYPIGTNVILNKSLETIPVKDANGNLKIEKLPEGLYVVAGVNQTVSLPTNPFLTLQVTNASSKSQDILRYTNPTHYNIRPFNPPPAAADDFFVKTDFKSKTYFGVPEELLTEIPFPQASNGVDEEGLFGW